MEFEEEDQGVVGVVEVREGEEGGDGLLRQGRGWFAHLEMGAGG